MQRIGMIFGGRSVEHEVSVITGHQAMAALPTDRYTAVPIYIAKNGQWYTGEVLRKLENFRDLEKLVAQAEPVTFSVNTPEPGLLVQRAGKRGLFGAGGPQVNIEPIDVAFPLIHGSHGEDGTLQGLFELANLPYVGFDVAASAITINKGLTKRLLRATGLPVIDEVIVSRTRWEKDSAGVTKEIESRFAYPVYVKPAHLGSSIGVSRAEDAMAMAFALDVAATYDDTIIVEPSQEGIIEINCAVLGHGTEVTASVCEQPISAGTLSYEEKYLRGGKTKGMKGAQRRIPAPISNELTLAIQEAAKAAFVAVGGAGVARIDFMVRPEAGQFFINEINSLPGSLSFYLFEPAGIAFPELLNRLIGYAQVRAKEKSRNTYSFNSSLLAGR
jgi:D-alanine-D-alanine ligase